MSFEDEKIQFLRDIGLTQESIEDAPSFDAMANYSELQDRIESLLLSELRALGYKWKEDAVFLYEDRELVHAMHELLSRRYRGEEDLVEEKILAAFAESNAEQPPGKYTDPIVFLDEVMEGHYGDLEDAANWVTQHLFARGQAKDAERNSLNYHIVNESIDSAHLLAKKLKLHRKSAKPTDLEINLDEAREKGWAITKAEDDTPDHEMQEHEDLQEEEREAADATSPAPAHKTRAPKPCKGLTRKLRASFLQDLGITKAAIEDEHAYETILTSPTLEITVVALVEALSRTLDYQPRGEFHLDFHDKGTVDAVHALLRAPFDCIESQRDSAVQEIIADVMEELHEQTEEAGEHATANPENEERARLEFLTNNILYDTTDFFINVTDHLLNSVLHDHPRSEVYDDPLHDLAQADRMQKAADYLANKYGLERQVEASEIPLAQILTRAAEHNLIQPDRKRGPH